MNWLIKSKSPLLEAARAFDRLMRNLICDFMLSQSKPRVNLSLARGGYENK